MIILFFLNGALNSFSENYVVFGKNKLDFL